MAHVMDTYREIAKLTLATKGQNRIRMTRRHRFVAVCLGHAVAAATAGLLHVAAANADANWVPKTNLAKAHTEQLSNGLTVILDEDHRRPTVAVVVRYNTHGGDLGVGRRGLPHLAEHLAFRATRHLPNWSPYLLIEDVGGHANAFTVPARTTFQSVIPSRYWERVLWIESDRMAFLAEAITAPVVDAERQVLAREWALRYQDVTAGRLGQMEQNLMYPAGHRNHFAWQTPEELRLIELTDVQQFVHNYYRPDNATLAIVGDFDSVTLRASVDRYFAGIRVPAVPLNPSNATVVEFFGHATATQVAPVAAPILVMRYAVPVTDPKPSQLLLLAALLEEQLELELVMRRMCSRWVHVTLPRVDDTWIFTIAIGLLPGVRHATVERALDGIIALLGSHPFPLEHLKRKLVVDRLQQQGDFLERARALVETFAAARPNLDDELRAIAQTSEIELQGLSRRVLPLNRRLVIRVQPALKTSLSGSSYQIDGNLYPKVRQ